jgi:hypothetical protein
MSMLFFKCEIQSLPSIYLRRDLQSLLDILLCVILSISAVLLYRRTADVLASTTMSNEPVLPSDLDIITAARQHVQENRQRPLGSGFYQSGFPLLQNGEPVAWIKTGDDSVADEAATQKHVYESFMQEPSLSNGVRVPKIYRVILCDDYPWTIIVMEYVSGRTVQQWLEISNKMEDLLFSRILEAMKVLLSLPPPQRNTPPGPAGGGRIDHLVFGSLYCEIGSAPRDFDSVQDLQNHMNQIVVSSENDTLWPTSFS